MLAVDVDEVLGGLAQLRDGRRAAVDPGAALALGVDRPAQQQAPGIVGHRLSKPASASHGAEARRSVELGADLGPRRALAHDAGIAAAAERQLQRIHQDRLAGAGLAGQDREAAPSNSTSSSATITKLRNERRRSMPAPQVSALTPECQWSLRRRVA